MAYNVPAVCDVFLCPIRKNAQHFYGHKKMWWSEAWEPLGDLAERNPNRRIGGLRIQSCYVPFPLLQLSFPIFSPSFKPKDVTINCKWCNSKYNTFPIRCTCVNSPKRYLACAGRCPPFIGYSEKTSII